MADKIFYKAEFVKSVFFSKDIPLDRPVFLFIGRSNVGKSTLINRLCRRKDLMRASKTPGATRSLNYALVDDSFYVVDAPGYGYASFQREHFGDLMSDVFSGHNNPIVKVYIVVDSRRTLFPADKEFAEYLYKLHRLYSFVFTKLDKLTIAQRGKLDKLRSTLADSSFYTEAEIEDSYQALRQDMYDTLAKKKKAKFWNRFETKE